MNSREFKAIRKALGMTQAELAKALDCSPKRIWSTEAAPWDLTISREMEYAMYWLRLTRGRDIAKMSLADVIIGLSDS